MVFSFLTLVIDIQMLVMGMALVIKHTLNVSTNKTIALVVKVGM